MLSKKRRREDRPSIHPHNRYAENPPDFAQLASLYSSFEAFVFFSRSGRPTIDWKDFNATRELTRVLLLHDHAVNWWIPDGQLCPTVPNRSNYIHWISDLLSSDLIPARHGSDDRVRGFDIGTGANCIYPLLGASLLGWSFVGSDVTDVALEWATKNVERNPHLLELIQIRNANDPFSSGGFTSSRRYIINENNPELYVAGKTQPLCQEVEESGILRQAVLVGVVKDGESFDFCMCNPPFFESIEEAGLNPKTSCGGTPEEMVFPGGEKAFISHIIEDSVVLQGSFRWFTTMVGKKANLKFLISKLREVGVSIVKTTEFVQGQTARWGLAWSFISPSKDFISSNTLMSTKISFTIEGLKRQGGAVQVLKSMESFFLDKGVSCKFDLSSFSVKKPATFFR
ncbi:methyltransferase-like protein 16 homolog isoform X2 [Phalaenopsis equestris]|uniref:methyltransferase-like protein 16 homolog isoform X2 n=1 Tax=Phalaenopsis equestris TaxID=78828 RepID=UPI0009E2A5BA|nr:methyltransferase-like protein 16 homolog isoform X2 [Phalaenopsis equestris]